jgi:hypothetical protein
MLFVHGVAHRSAESLTPFVLDPVRLLRVLLLELGLSALEVVRMAYDVQTMRVARAASSGQPRWIVPAHELLAQVEVGVVVTLLGLASVESLCVGLGEEEECLKLGIVINRTLVGPEGRVLGRMCSIQCVLCTRGS